MFLESWEDNHILKHKNIQLRGVLFEHKGEADFSKCIKFIQELSFQLILAISFCIKLYKQM